MLAPAGYDHAEVLRRDRRRCIYRARRASDGRSVVIKSGAAEAATAKDISAIRHEWEILHEIDLPGVVHAEALEQYDGTVALVVDDVGPRNLGERLAAGPLALDEFLELAVQLAETLGRLHAAHRIHRDVNPSNIVLDASGTRATLVDFGIATTLDVIDVQAESPAQIEGTLPYLSPEQTGRTSFFIDHRTDLYALGATFYEMLTGAPPFVSDDAVELVHSQLARRPRPVDERNRQVPRVVSDLIAKLLAKSPEDRYQSADALASDLRRMRDARKRTGQIAPFALGGDDVPHELRISGTLYGRDAEQRALTDAFERVCKGEREMVLLTGEAGVGKSALMRSIQPQLARMPGSFASGKFEALRCAEPYVGLLAAMRMLLQRLLAAPEDALSTWRGRLAEAVGPNGGVLAGVLPELEIVLGPQPEPPALPPSEAADRFLVVVQRFVRAFAREGAPLVLFLDDLQWADAASLRVLEQLLADPQQKHLLFVGALDDAEAGPEHPLQHLLSVARESEVVVRALRLGPLSIEDVSHLCADALATSSERVRPLAERIVHKTAGNPLFVRRLLHALYADGVVRFDAAKRAWLWDSAAVDRVAVSENVASLMVRALDRLPPACGELVAEAACMGATVDLRVLSELRRTSLPASIDALWPALEERLLVPIGPSYKLPRHEGPLDDSIASLDARFRFAHDRVWEAAIARLDEPRRRRTHLGVGRLLLEKMSHDGTEDRLFDVVDQMNAGAQLVGDASERLRLAELDLRAAQKAGASAAYRSALAYADQAAALLPADAWTVYGSLAFAISRERADCAYRCGEHALADAIIDQALARAPSRAQSLDLCDVRISARTDAGDLAGAIACGRRALAMLGEDVPASEQAADAARREMDAVLDALGDRRVETLADLPAMTDADGRVAMRLLTQLVPTAYFHDPPLCAYLTARAVHRSLRDGTSVDSAEAYAAYGTILVAATREPERAHAFGRLGVALARRLEDPRRLGRTLTAFALVNWWNAPVRTNVSVLREAARIALDVGELRFATYAMDLLVQTMMAMGAPLHEVLDESEHAIATARKANNRLSSPLALRQAARCLMGLTRSPETFEDEGFDEARLLRGADSTASCVYEVARLQCAVLFGQLELARRMARASSSRLPFVPSLFARADHAFHSAIAYTSSCDGAGDAQRTAWLAEVRAQEALLAGWAEACPENFAHKRDLVRAEIASLSGDPWTAHGLYERAIDAAHQQGFVQDEALAAERAARCLVAHDRPRAARRYLEEALHAYARWGATAKVEALARASRGLLSGLELRPAPATAGTPVSQTVAAFDALSLVKSVQAISEEMGVERLLEKLLRNVLESAGAERGALLIEERGALTVRARGSVQEGVSLERAPIGADWPESVIRYVWRSGEPVVLADAKAEGPFVDDPCVRSRAVRSVLCVPVQRRRRSVGVVYLENRMTPYAFGADRVEIVRHLAAQLAISLENAQLLRSKDDAARARDEFLTVAAHELRTPLTPLFLQWSILEAVLRELGPEVARKAAPPLQQAKRQLDRMSDLVENLLDIAHIASGQVSVLRERADLAELVRDAVQRFGPKFAQAGCTVRLDARGPAVGMWDRQRLEQAVTQLLSNAAKFGAGAPVEITVESTGGVARLVVQDHGIGITPGDEERIFRPFERAVSTRHYGGFGVGLWIAHEIIEGHGGSIRVESQPGAGARFIVELPRSARVKR